MKAIRGYNISYNKTEVLVTLDVWAKQKLLHNLAPVQKCWQASDFLPKSSDSTFVDEIREIQKNAIDMPYECLVSLVGNAVTEEALPTYMNMLNRTHDISDKSGNEDHPWAIWTRAWTAEENRHGDILNRYLYLCGRVNMRQVEVSIQHLITNGMNAQLDNNPYSVFVYTSFQERATKISHSNISKKARAYGNIVLSKICNSISQDEARHEIAYSEIIREIFAIDPDGAMLAFANMMFKGIVMPAHLISDGVHEETNNGNTLFKDYSTVSEESEIYTSRDYLSIFVHLMKIWNIENINTSSSDALFAQEYLCKHGDRLKKIVEYSTRSNKKKATPASFSWIS